jgi:hypothetical protein
METSNFIFFIRLPISWRKEPVLCCLNHVLATFLFAAIMINIVIPTQDLNIGIFLTIGHFFNILACLRRSSNLAKIGYYFNLFLLLVAIVTFISTLAYYNLFTAPAPPLLRDVHIFIHFQPVRIPIYIPLLILFPLSCIYIKLLYSNFCLWKEMEENNSNSDVNQQDNQHLQDLNDCSKDFSNGKNSYWMKLDNFKFYNLS